VRAFPFDILPVRSNPPDEKQYDEDDQDATDDTDATIRVCLCCVNRAGIHNRRPEDESVVSNFIQTPVS
jgi:hypothetical protein